MENREDLIKQKHEIEHKLCELEFEEKGYMKRVEDLKISYKVYYRTPLGKNIEWQFTIGIPIIEHTNLMKDEKIIIIGIINPREIDNHIFYVYSFKEGKGGVSKDHEYIDIKRKINDKWKTLLPTIEEYLNEREKEEKN